MPDPSGHSGRPDQGGDAEDAARPALRFGWIAKGLLFVVIGLLSMELARRGYSSEQADQSGALETIAEAPAGRALVLTVSVGLLFYALWQVWAALVQDSDGLVHLAKRVGWVGLGLAYGLLAVTGIQIGLSDSGSSRTSSSGGGPTSPSGIAQRLFEIPGGRALVVAVGIGTALVGAYQLRKGIVGDFFDDIVSDDLDRRHRWALRAAGTAGFCARALVLGIAGWLFVDAARKYNPERAAGLDDSLRALASVPHGRVLLLVTGVGLVAAGVYDMTTFRRQRIDEVS